ncbi:MAG TPA: beta-propeller fold lactonase family protein [Candidatus Acidoferrales bacterium]|nr:beta-propeller fold lactonase family protein [Candidatus Acidoferrales bacterium]
MKVFRALWFFLSALPCLAATFGTVVSHPQPLADLAIDEARRRLYVVNTASNQVEVYATNVNPPRLSATIKTEATPLAIAISPPQGTTAPRYLYVVCYDASSLDVVDLTSATFATTSVTLAAKPQGVAVGFNGKVLISTIGTGTGADVLVTYDPSAAASQALAAVTVTPPAPVAPTLPPPNGIMAFAAKSRLQASADGTKIIGVHMQAATRSVWVFDVASSTVLAARTVTGISSALAVSPDASRFLSGSMLFETATLLVLAQQNTTNSPYTFPAGANFATQTAQGGAVFTPDGSGLLAAYNIVPVLNPAAKTNAAQLTVNTPDTLLIQLGIMLPENLGARMIITSDGATAYAISQSGFIVLPIGTVRNQPLAMPDSNVALLGSDQCGVTAAINSAVIPVRNIGGGSRMTVTAQVLAPASTSATVTAAAKSYGADVTAKFNSAAARNLGTAAADQILLQSNEAINIVPAVRVFQNNRNAEARGSIVPIDWGASATGLADLLVDSTRQRLYIANPGLNRLEVFDMQKQTFLAPIPVGQLPRSMAFGNDGQTLYVASGGGETISVVDLTLSKTTGRVAYPALPFNSTAAVVTPALMASSQRGVQLIMSDGTLWRIVGNNVVPRLLNPNIFGTLRSVPAPQTMASTPEGAYVLILGGNGTAFLYSSSDDDFVAARSVIPTPIQGYYGPIAAAPNGQYYLVNDQVLNQALTPIGSSATGPVGGGGLPSPGGPSGTGRPVSAVAAVTGQLFARYSTPVTAGNAAPTDAGLAEVVDVTSFQTAASAAGLESPATIARTGQRVNVLGRSMAVDPAGANAFVITASGLSIVPMGNSSTPAPSVPASGVVNVANFQPAVAPNGLIAIIGRNLATTASAASTTLPTILGGTCVTLNNSPLPLIATSAGQINAQLPTTLAAGRYPLVVRSIAGQAASSSVNVTVAKYAPAIFVDSDGPAIYHSDGTRVDKDHPGHRDEKLTIYATGMGTTTGGKVTAGTPSPASPLAVTGPVNLYFGNPLIKEAAIIVNWSGLLPGSIGVYQVTCTIPGAHINGDSLPVSLKIGGVSSPTSGANVPFVAVQ